MEFAARLAEARRARGLTQQELAARAGVHVTQLRRYEGGVAEPGLRVLRGLAVALSVSTDELLFDGPRRPKDTELAFAFEAAEHLAPADRAVVVAVVEGLVAKDDARRRSPGARRPR